MELTVTYVISQIITVIYYGLLSSSYFVKDRIKILMANFTAHIGQTVAMAMLSGYTGACMAFVMMLRDLTFLILEKKRTQEETKEKVDLIVLVVTIILIVALTIWAYNGPLSLLSVVATLISTFAIWQKNDKIYRWLGLLVGLIWLAYDIYIISIMAIILETILIISSIVGIIENKKKEKSNIG